MPTIFLTQKVESFAGDHFGKSANKVTQRFRYMCFSMNFEKL